MDKKIFVLLFFGVMMSSCDSNQIHSEYKSLPNHWPIDQTLEFQLPELDSLKSFNLFFNIRNTNDYNFNNLFLITSMNFPNGKVVIDTLEYQMALPDGTWLGSGNRIKENKLWYKENVHFFEEGLYSIKIRQAMRNNASVEGVKNLEGITDVGVIIEETQEERE
ncbi:gliding motility lipoprotein GldH [Planktosalinus lacus]|uniref:Gliding motility lipoprotein GldH n=1 Tax=Planktosalinus lacus TaxID=1526573 RepID=A0A8J2Y8C5_9FLAO|nr:gliding motility lipoprotein GldH [Planktosalinus lacus]GGD79716.1 gliding motility lipoprotein GldH [Planktosalinus lacus]